MATNMLDVLPVILLTDEAQFTRDDISALNCTLGRKKFHSSWQNVIFSAVFL
jgi:hypothetical protein